MAPIMAFFVVIGILALGDVIAVKSKAFIPSLFVFVVLLTIGAWTGLFPGNVVELSGVSANLTSVTMVLAVINMGSTLSLRELKKQWKTVLIGLGAVLGVGCAVLTIGSAIFGRDMAIVAAPPVSGGLVASYEMAEAARAKGLDSLATVALLTLTLQSFPAYVILPSILKKQSRDYLKSPDFKNHALAASNTQIAKKRLIPAIPERYASSSVYLFSMALVGALAYLCSMLSTKIIPPHGISTTIFGLIFGVIAGEIGLIDPDPLRKSNSYGYLMIASIIGVLASIATVDKTDVLNTILPIFALVVIAMTGIAFLSILIGRMLKFPWAMSFAIGLNCLLGFPTNYILTTEAIKTVAQTKEEEDYLQNKMVPVMLVGGFTTVTIGSVVFAGILKNFL